MAIQKVESVKSGKTQVFSLEEFTGLKEFREFTVKGKIDFCIERAELMRDFIREKGGLDYTDPMTRQAEALKYILEHKKPKISPNETSDTVRSRNRRVSDFYRYY